MKKLFKAIRHGELEEVKVILESRPEAVNEPSTPPPKKDNMLSPLQVALKIGEFDIAKYLIEHGADVNYIEPDGTTTWRMPVIQDAIGAVFFAYEGPRAKPEAADKATEIVRDLLERGADPNVLSWKTIVRFGEAECNPDVDAIGKCISGVFSYVNASEGTKFERQAMVVERFNYLMDLLLAHGADMGAWADRGVGSSYYQPDRTNREYFLDDFLPIQGQDRSGKMRAFMQDFCKKRGLLNI